MYNYAKLLGKIKERGYTQEKLAASIGLSATALNNKLKNKVEFKVSEIEAICNALDINKNQASDYFLVSM